MKGNTKLTNQRAKIQGLNGTLAGRNFGMWHTGREQNNIFSRLNLQKTLLRPFSAEKEEAVSNEKRFCEHVDSCWRSVSFSGTVHLGILRAQLTCRNYVPKPKINSDFCISSVKLSSTFSHFGLEYWTVLYTGQLSIQIQTKTELLRSKRLFIDLFNSERGFFIIFYFLL